MNFKIKCNDISPPAGGSNNKYYNMKHLKHVKLSKSSRLLERWYRYMIVFTVCLNIAVNNSYSQTVISFTITQPPTLTVTNTVTDVSCNGGIDGTITVTTIGGTPSYTYELFDSTGTLIFTFVSSDTSETIIWFPAGDYSITVTDTNGCTASDSITINEPAALGLTTGSADASCGNNDGMAWVAITGGTVPYSYLWNDPMSQTTDTAINLYSGSYSVWLTDANGCADSATSTINDLSGPAITIDSVIDVSCNAGSDGAVYISVSGGTLPYTYLWSDSVTTEDNMGLSANSYTISVTDANGCNAIDSITITEPDTLFYSSSGNDASCFWACDGDATETPSGGTPPYTYQWDDPGSQTNAMAAGLCAGYFEVTITDANGCIAVDGIDILQPAVLTIDTVSVSHESSTGNSDGSIDIIISGGTTPYTYLWNDPASQTTEDISGLTAGTYTVTITDSNDCTDSLSVTINVLSTPPAISVSGTDASCNSICDGTATVTTSGGTPPFTYLWDDPLSQTTQTATGLCIGTYSITVTDSNYYSVTQSINIPTSNNLIINFTSSLGASCIAICDGVASAGALGGTKPYT
ncbi:MAG: SprB repeat-containing protein, partial [Bacteroidota bacterium]